MEVRTSAAPDKYSLYHCIQSVSTIPTINGIFINLYIEKSSYTFQFEFITILLNKTCFLLVVSRNPFMENCVVQDDQTLL